MGSEGTLTEHIPLYGVLIEDEELAASEAALRAGWLGMGLHVERFEHGVRHAVRAEHHSAVAVSTGGAALHIAMLVAGVGPGTEVLLPSLTHLADVQAVLAAGGEPVFCDVDDQTLCIDVERAAEQVNERTRVILAADYAGHLCDHRGFARLAERHRLRVVHDAAHSFGSSYEGQAVGSFSDICVFSFDPVKALTCIDAGVLVLRPGPEGRMARELRLLGTDQPSEVMYKNARTWDYDTVRPGFRYHLSNLHAAIGLAQLAKLDRIRANRKASCCRYQEQLKGIDPVRAPDSDFVNVNPFLYYIRVPAGERDALRAHLAERGIETGIHWRPAHLHTLFAQSRRGPLDVTERAASELIALPLHSTPLDTAIDAVCEEITAYFR